MRKGKNNMRGSGKDIMYSGDEASDSDWWRQSAGSFHCCMVNWSSGLSQDSEVHGEKDHEKQDGSNDGSRTLREWTVKNSASMHTTSIKRSGFWKLAKRKMTRREKMCSIVREEAVVGSGAVECVTSRKRMLHLRVIRDSRIKAERDMDMRVGGNKIKTKGKVTVTWWTDLGAAT